MFFFTQNYEQNATRNFSAGFLSPFLPFPVTQTSPQADLDDVGIGFFGQGVVTLSERVDLTAGLRFDHEQKDATLNVFFTPAIAPPQQTVADEGFSNVSPQFAAAFHLQPGRTVYVSVANGYKAGGFNAASPPGTRDVRRRAHVELRRRPEDDVGEWTRGGERCGVPHRLGGHAAESAEPLRAR